MSVAKQARKRRLSVSLFIAIALLVGAVIDHQDQQRSNLEKPPALTGLESIQQTKPPDSSSALTTLGKLAIKGRAPKTGYQRVHFGDGWAKSDNCDTRNRILQRDLKEVTLQPGSCIVHSGVLDDPYTGRLIRFVRGSGTSQVVQIDHVVALSDAWQKGGQLLSRELREQFANDPLNLLAVEGRANQNKGDGDAATWLPANKAYRCSYVARQVAVKYKYSLWITLAEHDAIDRILQACPDQSLPGQVFDK